MKGFDFKIEYAKTIVGDMFIEEKINFVRNRKAYFATKRAFDVVCAILGIAISFIPSLIIVILIKVTSCGPIFYLQDRLGQYGKPFKIIKFRTMKIDAEESGPMWAEIDDPRITKFGRILRKSHIDEIPQFINVLRGDLSMVGPRPERECFYREFEKYIDGFDQRMLVPQGITGFAQVSGGYALKPEEKIVYDLYYVCHCNFIQDIWILMRTIIH